MKQFIILLLCITFTAIAGAIREGTLQALSDGTNVTVQWGSTDESSVKMYEIERRSGTSGDFSYLATVQKKGSNSFYQYVDKSAFKSSGTIYQYRIKTVYNNNSVEYSSEVTVSHKVNSVKRTWGSLKAMFR